MKKKFYSHHVLLLFTALVSTLTISAQSSVHSSGATVSGSGGSVSYSIGQTSYVTHKTSAGSVSEGVQQAYLISSVGISSQNVNLSHSVYPNPTTDILTLDIDPKAFHNSSYTLTDLQGRRISENTITAPQTKINMQDLSSASYILKIQNKKQELIGQFQIIKK